MGYGDVKCNYLEGKIPTPHLDRLASHGMRLATHTPRRRSARRPATPC